jgi:integrase
VFGEVAPAAIRPADINRYLRDERGDAPARANREFALLSNLCRTAVARGDMNLNPCKEVRANELHPRTEAPEPDDLLAFLQWAQARGDRPALVLAGMAEFVALAGSRRIEFRTLHWPQVSDTEVRLTRAKQRGRDVAERVEISPALADLLARMRLLAADPRIGVVFPASGGDAYNESAFKSAWSRLQREALAAGVLKRRIRFHDLRAYYVTAHKQIRGALPDLHGNPAITARVYDRSKQSRRKAL